MKWIAETKTPKHIRCLIDDETDDLGPGEYTSGYFIYIYEGNNPICTWDYHYESLEGAKRHAFKNFNVPLDSWIQIE